MPAAITALDIITRALLEISAFQPGEVPPPDDTGFCVGKLGAMLDAWNSDGLNIFATDFLQLMLVPNIQPLLIGQGVAIMQVSADGANPNNGTFIARNTYKVGDVISTGSIGVIGGVNFNLLDVIVTSATPKQFTAVLATPSVVVGNTAVVGKGIYSTPEDIFPNYVTVGARPVKIIDANIILNNLNPIVKVPLHIRDEDWWIKNAVPTVPSSIPTDLFYSSDFPNGKIYLWPMQNVNYGLELEVWNNIAELPDVTAQFYMPQGYQDFVAYSLAEALCPAYGKEVPTSLGRLLAKATLRVQNNNSKSPRMGTRDSGIPGGGGKGSYFNWLSGTVVPPR